MTDSRTAQPGGIPRAATPLLRLVLKEWLDLNKAHMNPDRELAETERTLLMSRKVDLFAVVYLLAALRDLNPEHADRVAARLADQLAAGDSLGEWVDQWHRELNAGRPLTLHLDEDPADGAISLPDETHG
jgi:hypothetical protein